MYVAPFFAVVLGALFIALPMSKSRTEVQLRGGGEAGLPAGGAVLSAHGVRAAASQAGLPYLLSAPQCGAEKSSLPLVLFLHGAGESGRDPWGLLPGYDTRRGWLPRAPAPVRLTPPGLAVDAHPLCEGVAVLAPVTDQGWSASTHAGLLALLDEVLASNPCIDPTRVVLTGISMGGAGAWLLGARHPERFAAVSPICGYAEDGGIAAVGGALKGTPLFVAHGKNDAVVPYAYSLQLVDAARRAGNGAVVFDEADGVAPAGAPFMNGHDSWSAVYGSAAWWAWAKVQRRP
jgi:predicted peptidase